ncbi:MAG: hypothetical protein ACRDFB_00805 [Rhabdochlamydiaceae bacterium]
MDRIREVFTENKLATIAYLLSISLAFLSFVIYAAVWQSTINGKVSANSDELQGVQQSLNSMQTQINTINIRTSAIAQQVNDIQSTSNLILQKVSQ